MTFQRLYFLARVALDDVVAPYLLTEDVALDLFNEAEQEACRRSPLLIDAETPAVCQIPVVAGTALYALDSRITKMIAASLASAPAYTPMRQLAVEDMDQRFGQWRNTSGKPYILVTGFATGKIRLFPTPIVDDVLELRVWRTPLVEMTAGSSPEIPERYHRSLVQWVVAAVRSIEDTERYDPRKAAQAMAQYEAEFGPRRSAFSEVCARLDSCYSGMN